MLDLKPIAEAIRAELVADLCRSSHKETLVDPSDLKSAHRIDLVAAQAAHRVVKGHRCNIFVESVPDTWDAEAEFSLYIDPVDGSLNWDRGVGDPCVVIALSSKPLIESLNDLEEVYVLGLRSGDRYYMRYGRAYYLCALTGQESEITPPQTSIALAGAVAYLRPGYGLARRQLERTYPLFLAARDIRAMDNTGIEFCEIARGAAHLMVEARGDGQKGSDFFNLLAWPILRAAGGALWTLEGDDLTTTPIDVKGTYNYIAAIDEALAREVREKI